MPSIAKRRIRRGGSLPDAVLGEPREGPRKQVLATGMRAAGFEPATTAL
jgi:hypothetical protein